ncbi:hypothetical protein N0V90_005739 [Kalmusia sp. IMI 367209]|nr:hypothetical protein N0V90_005739 [Kalmusia sp. IMI 367209]
MFGTSLAAVGTIGHELHRVRRSALNGFFSKRSVSKLESAIREVIDHGCKLLECRGAAGRVLNLRSFFAAFSADVIGQVAFGSNYGLLDRTDFEPGWQRLMMLTPDKDLSRGTHLMKQFPWAYPILKIIPPALVSLFHPPGERLFSIRNDIRRKIEQMRTLVESRKSVESKIQNNDAQLTALQTLLTSPIPATEFQTPRLEDEAFTLLGAGTVTTAHTLTTVLYHVLANPMTKSLLENEISNLVGPTTRGRSNPTLSQLEHAPYLSAIISEGLRLAFGVSHRLPRISPDTALHYRSYYNGLNYDYTIPPGVPVSMTPMFMHLDPTVFPSPHTFDPQRWLSSPGDEAEQEELMRRKQYLVPFSKGTRMCAGMHLAYAELYLMLGALFAPDGVGRKMELFDTGIEDVECMHDFFNPSPRLDSKGMRVVLKERLIPRPSII